MKEVKEALDRALATVQTANQQAATDATASTAALAADIESRVAALHAAWTSELATSTDASAAAVEGLSVHVDDKLQRLSSLTAALANALTDSSSTIDVRLQALDRAIEAVRAAQQQAQTDKNQAVFDIDERVNTLGEMVRTSLEENRSMVMNVMEEQSEAKESVTTLVKDVEERLVALRVSITAEMAPVSDRLEAVESRCTSITDRLRDDIRDWKSTVEEKLTALDRAATASTMHIIDEQQQAVLLQQQVQSTNESRLRALDTAVSVVQEMQDASLALSSDVEQRLEDLRALWTAESTRLSSDIKTSATSLDADVTDRLQALRASWTAELTPVLDRVSSIESGHADLGRWIERQREEQQQRFNSIDAAMRQKDIDAAARAALQAQRMTAFAEITLRLDSIAANMQSFAAADVVSGLSDQLDEVNSTLASFASIDDVQGCISHVNSVVDSMAMLDGRMSALASVEAVTAIGDKLDGALHSFSIDSATRMEEIQAMERRIEAQLEELRTSAARAMDRQSGGEAVAAQVLAAATERIDNLESKIDALGVALGDVTTGTSSSLYDRHGDHHYRGRSNSAGGSMSMGSPYRQSPLRQRSEFISGTSYTPAPYSPRRGEVSTHNLDSAELERRLAARLDALAGKLVGPIEGRLDGLSSRLEAVGSALKGCAPLERVDALAVSIELFGGSMGHLEERVDTTQRQQLRVQQTLVYQNEQLQATQVRLDSLSDSMGSSSPPPAGHSSLALARTSDGHEAESDRAHNALMASRIASLERRIDLVAALASPAPVPALPQGAHASEVITPTRPLATRDELQDLRMSLDASLAEVVGSTTASLSQLTHTLDETTALASAELTASKSRYDALDVKVDRARSEAASSSLQVFALENKCDAALEHSLSLSATNMVSRTF